MGTAVSPRRLADTSEGNAALTLDIDLQGITIGAFQIRFYSVMILSGLAAGVVLARWEAQRLGENAEHVLNIAILGAALGLAGARMYHVVDLWDSYYRANPGQIVAIWNGGIGIFGAIGGATVALVIYVRWKRMSLLRWLDIGAPAFLLGQAIGRWGNFFNQELFGPPSNLPWAIPIRPENRPSMYLDAETFHPLFLYESLLSLAGVVVMVYLFWRFGPRLTTVGESGVAKVLGWASTWRLRPGDLLLLYFIWYPAERFGLEFLRNSPWTQEGVPMAQWISGALLLIAVSALIWRHVRPWQPTPRDGFHEGRRSRSSLRRQQRRAG
jgi:phosphatidylglycerol:prolipoprotein diacylglycerol transferase